MNLHINSNPKSRQKCVQGVNCVQCILIKRLIMMCSEGPCYCVEVFFTGIINYSWNWLDTIIITDWTISSHTFSGVIGSNLSESTNNTNIPSHNPSASYQTAENSAFNKPSSRPRRGSGAAAQQTSRRGSSAHQSPVMPRTIANTSSGVASSLPKRDSVVVVSMEQGGGGVESRILTHQQEADQDHKFLLVKSRLICGIFHD